MRTELVSKETARQNGASAGNISTISVVVPVYNEVEFAFDFSDRHHFDCKPSKLRDYLCGSTDGSAELLKQQAQTRTDLKAVLRRNYGQTAAMAAGFNYAWGKAIITLDGDLRMIHLIFPVVGKVREYDLVSGWRQRRQDAALTRLLPSKIANWLIGLVTGVKLHDYGCSLNLPVGTGRRYASLWRVAPPAWLTSKEAKLQSCQCATMLVAMVEVNMGYGGRSGW